MKTAVFVLTFALVLGWLGHSIGDNGLEQALADEAARAQRDETWKADRVAKQISACIEKRGSGAVPVFDEVGFVVGCEIRRKS